MITPTPPDVLVGDLQEPLIMVFLLPPLVTIVEVVVTSTIGTIASLAARDLYERVVKSEQNTHNQ